MDAEWQAWAERVEARLARFEKRQAGLDKRLKTIEPWFASRGADGNPMCVELGIELLERVAKELNKRVTALENGVLKYCGTWDQERDYAAGSMVTDHGSSWVAIAPCGKGERPAKGPGWRLTAKGSPRVREYTVR